MASNGKTNDCSILSKLGLKPLTKCNLVKFYVPIAGAASHTAMSVSVMNPSLAARISPKWDVTNALLVATLVGTGTYIYTRKHLQNAPACSRICYSATGAILLSFGSVLACAILRSITPPNPTTCTILGLGTSILLIKIGSSYLQHVDENVK
ncbi:uncharacterized protein LOC122502805 [Leptopilina heterotoma]|uniref:uncharacterized protein LOC122502805 n=1 Tax=Leptopilina heterotoma TaxID=63436 RepID=UPI001CA9879F|nr:uncharacterized protein LOC122502805 [Leptopilina heterotoma]